MPGRRGVNVPLGLLVIISFANKNEVQTNVLVFALLKFECFNNQNFG